MMDTYQAAVNAFLAGRPKEAETICRKILKQHPNAHPALHLLAMTEKRRGKFKLAIKTFNKALKVAPETAMYWNNLGETYRETGSLKDAVNCYRKAIEYRPEYAEAYSNWGIALMGLAQLAEAEQKLIRATEIKSGLANAYFNLGTLYIETNEPEKARQALKQVLSIDPDNADAYVNLAHLAKEAGQPSEAYSRYLQAIACDPTHFEAHLNLGNLYYQRKQYGNAVTHCEKAVELSPNSLDAWLGLGYAQMESGRHLAACAAFKKAATINQRSVDAILGLSKASLGYGDKDGAFQALERCRKITGEDQEPRLHLQQARVYLSAGERALAKKEARRCLALNKESGSAYRIIAQTKSFQDPDDDDLREMIALYNRPELLAEERNILAFTIAMAMESIGDYDAAFDYLEQGNRSQRTTFDYDIDTSRQYIEALCDFYNQAYLAENTPVENEGITPIFIVGMPRSGTSLVEQIVASHPAVEGAGELNEFNWLFLNRCGTNQKEKTPGYFDKLTPNDFKQIGEGYLAALSERFPGACWVTDKMPSNFFHLGAIRLALPQAKIIHCSRDSVDTCLSIYQQTFEGFHPYAYDMTELGTYYRLYQQLMAHLQEVLGEYIYTIRYEDLVTDQERETRALLEFCGLEFDPACLEFYKADRAVLTASITQVRKPMYRSSIKRWHHYRHRLHPLLTALGLEETS